MKEVDTKGHLDAELNVWLQAPAIVGLRDFICTHISTKLHGGGYSSRMLV